VSEGDPLTSVRIQTVLYRPAPGDVDRLLASVDSAVRLARDQNDRLSVSVAVGDSSPIPTLTLAQVEELQTKLSSAGGIGLTYDFFGGNLGSAGGHNRLLEQLNEEFVLFLNPDAYISPFLFPELALQHNDSGVGIVEARQIPLEHPKAFDPNSGDTSWASTAGALVKRSVIDAIGGFDADSFFLYCDDVDFSWRARLAGFRVVYEPAARIFHDKRLTLDGVMAVGDAEHYYAAEAALMLAWKYSRPDLAATWSQGMLDGGGPLQQQAATRFLARQAAGELPAAIDPEGRVAQFLGTDFAEHRFSYADA
jgi:hypothetical protein